MAKLGLLLYVSALFLYCRYLAAFVGNDIPVYISSVACSLFALRQHPMLSKAFLFNFLFIQGITTWICHFFLDAPYQLVTSRLVYFRGMLLGLFLVLEILAATHIVRRYLSVRRQSGTFACDAFAHALSPYPMLPELYKVFYVEFNIWRALAIRLGIARDRDGATMKPVSRIDPGYRSSLILAGISVLLIVNILCFWYLPPLWTIAPLLGSIYVALLLNCELLQFERHAIYADDRSLRIPNGIYGFVSIDKSNIERISVEAPDSPADLSISRLLPANLHLHLAEPIRVFDAPVRTVSLCVQDAPEQDVALALAHG